MDEEPSNSSGLKRLIPQALKNEVAVIAAKRPCESGIYTPFNELK